MRYGVWGLTIVVGACGPTVSPLDDDEGGGDATVGDDTASATDTAAASSEGTGDADATAADDVLDDSDGSAGVCGDGTLDADEACDDGNLDNADGCSAACQVSGTLLWSVPLEAGRSGFGVGIDVRDGEAYTAVQIYEALDPVITTSRVGADGTLLGSYIDEGGFSDLDFARQPIASTPSGDVVAGYFSLSPDNRPIPDQRRMAALLDLDRGPTWAFTTEERWPALFGTIWREEGVFILHSLEAEQDEELVVEWLDHDGTHVGALPLGLSTQDARPLARGGFLVRPLPTLGVLALDPGGQLEYHAALLPTPGFEAPPTWFPTPVATIEVGSLGPRAYSDGLGIGVWTETERIEIDVMDHLQPAQPRAVLGSVLVSFANGFVISEDSDLEVYGLDDALRWSATSTLRPRFARADGDAGLFVLSDGNLKGSEVSLDYYVL